ncbi:MAG TPA: SH3 domain-containing protein [Thermosynechococcaceae cyanobacterium]
MSVLLAISSISLLAAAPAFADSAVLKGRDTGSRVNVRSAPSSDSYAPHYGLVGDLVDVIRSTQGADGYTWYLVSFPSGATGWVRGDLVQPIN